jgi:aspartyl-tRNA(Asn)/glutamyl-tRNA(Gln) amidotransferase subunit C
MALTQTEVRYIAQLAKLQLTEDEVAHYQEQLSAILDYAESLNQLDTSAIAPTATVLPLRTVLRPDVARPAMERSVLLQNAPAIEAGCFRVPPVLDDAN